MTTPKHVSGTIKADAVRLADQAETLAAPLVGQHEALQKHHLETAAALRTLAAIQPDPQPVATRSKLELVATPPCTCAA